MIIKNGKLFIDGCYHEGLSVCFRDGFIVEIGPDLTDDEVIDAQGNLVFAGFIDSHNHGGYGLSFEDGFEAVNEICRRLPENGVTSVVPTLGPDSIESGTNSVRAIRQVRNSSLGADPFAIHFEGPYFSPERHASWNLEIQRNPSKEFTLGAADNDLSDVLLINTAPELPGALQWIPWAVSQGVRVELCYTTASADLIKQAADLGATQISHLYNGFEALHQRTSGPVVGCLLEDRLKAQLTCDGIHVAAAWIKLAIKVKGIDNVYAITDSSKYAGLPLGERDDEEFGKVIIHEDRAVDYKGMLISGSAPWDVVMRAAKNKIGLSMEEIGSMFSESPAKCLAIKDRGKIEVGRHADFTLTDNDLNIHKTIILGKTVYEK